MNTCKTLWRSIVSVVDTSVLSRALLVTASSLRLPFPRATVVRRGHERQLARRGETYSWSPQEGMIIEDGTTEGTMVTWQYLLSKRERSKYCREVRLEDATPCAGEGAIECHPTATSHPTQRSMISGDTIVATARVPNTDSIV